MAAGIKSLASMLQQVAGNNPNIVRSSASGTLSAAHIRGTDTVAFAARQAEVVRKGAESSAWPGVSFGFPGMEGNLARGSGAQAMRGIGDRRAIHEVRVGRMDGGGFAKKPLRLGSDIVQEGRPTPGGMDWAEGIGNVKPGAYGSQGHTSPIQGPSGPDSFLLSNARRGGGSATASVSATAAAAPKAGNPSMGSNKPLLGTALNRGTQNLFGSEGNPLGQALVMGGVGGIASLMGGGGFFQGAAIGMAGGFGAGKAHNAIKSNQGAIQASLGPRIAKGGVRGTLSKGAAWAAPQASNLSRRTAMLGGAGLAGVMGGGHRDNNKRRGFNQHRGNTF